MSKIILVIWKIVPGLSFNGHFLCYIIKEGKTFFLINQL
jgi:hypothetical protein